MRLADGRRFPLGPVIGHIAHAVLVAQLRHLARAVAVGGQLLEAAVGDRLGPGAGKLDIVQQQLGRVAANEARRVDPLHFRMLRVIVRHGHLVPLPVAHVRDGNLDAASAERRCSPRARPTWGRRPARGWRWWRSRPCTSTRSRLAGDRASPPAGRPAASSGDSDTNTDGPRHAPAGGNARRSAHRYRRALRRRFPNRAAFRAGRGRVLRTRSSSPVPARNRRCERGEHHLHAGFGEILNDLLWPVLRSLRIGQVGVGDAGDLEQPLRRRRSIRGKRGYRRRREGEPERQQKLHNE